MAQTQTANTDQLEKALQANNEKQKQSVDPYRKAQAYLKKMEPAISEALPKNTGMTAERLSRITLTTIKTNPNLLNCSIESLLGAVLQSAQLGLEPNLNGSCYFIPMKNVVSFQIGYKGLIDLVTRRGEVKAITAKPRYENDLFEEEYGIVEVFRHKPAPYADRGKLMGFYAYAHLNNGGFKAEYMSIEEIEKIRNSHSQAYQGAKKYNNENGSVWVKHFEAMSIKTVIKKLCKHLPISVEAQEAIAHDETIRKDITADAIHVDKMSEEGELFTGEIVDGTENN